ncbi:MAG TPA: AEC family transporter [Casimicrobiaceae bacterium]
MRTFFALLDLTAPLFVLIGVGYVLTRWGRWPLAAADTLTRFVFAIAIPTLLFRLMSEFAREPRVDARLLVAFFGGCFVVYAIARFAAFAIFRMDGTAQSVFAMGGIFANNVLLGLPLAKVTLGEAALPAVSLVLVFNSLLLWTLATVSVEWARHRDFSLAGLGRTLIGVIRNPIVASILIGTAFGFTGFMLPTFVDQTLVLVSEAAIPLSLIALGMGLAGFGGRSGWHISGAIAFAKLVLHPLAVYLLARLLDLPALETAAVVMLASLPIGANVYLMSRQFDVLTGPIASGIVLTTVLAAVTTPLVLTLCRAPL